MTDSQLPTTKLHYCRSLPQLYQSVRCKKKDLFVENIGEKQKKDLHVCKQWRTQDLAKWEGGTPGGLRVKSPAVGGLGEGSPQLPMNFCSVM